MIFTLRTLTTHQRDSVPAAQPGGLQLARLLVLLLALLVPAVPASLRAADHPDAQPAPDPLLVCPQWGVDDGESPFASVAAALDVAEAGTTISVFADPGPDADQLVKEGVTIEYLGAVSLLSRLQTGLPIEDADILWPNVATSSNVEEVCAAAEEEEDIGPAQITEGDLVLPHGTVITEDFTFFNSAGAVQVEGNVTVAAGVSGLILVSPIHLADGATVTVEGDLVIDGGSVSSAGSFSIVIAEGASFALVRSTVAGGTITTDSGAVVIRDNVLEGAQVSVTSAATGAVITHNLTDGAGWLTDNGIDTVTVVDGWGNVSSTDATANRLLLGFDADLLLAGRTVDGSGNLFIQPGDPVYATVNLAGLTAKISGIEILLGYNTGLMDAVSVGLSDDWDVEIVSFNGTNGAIGKLDAALGLSFDFSDPAGTDADQTFADVELAALTTEGQTVFFHRVKRAEDTFGGETRLTTGGPNPAYLTPFTVNSAMITIDGTPPVVDSAGATVEQGGVDMTLEGNLTVAGVLTVTVAAHDGLAGLAEGTAAVTLTDPDDSTVIGAGVLTGTDAVDVGGVTFTEFAFDVTLTTEMPNGVFHVAFAIADRSGNLAQEVLGAIEINRNAVEATVQLEGLVAGPVTRDVTFTFTAADGSVLETRTETLTFASGQASVTLTAAPADAARLSAKTAWNLRRRVDLDFDAQGQATAGFTGDTRLLGGDLTGSNTVGTMDFAILRNFFNRNDPEALVADITGSGSVGTIDFAVLRTNFNLAGDPP